MTSTFQLLQNEGFLLQNSFKTSLSALRTWRREDRGAFYGAFFGFTIGLERFLKVLILLDYWHRNRTFPTNLQLKKHGGDSGHDVEKLYEFAQILIQQFGVERKDDLEPDKIDRKLLTFLSCFAKRSRYYNLETLTGEESVTDPLGEWEDLLLEIYEKDVPKQQRLPDLDENDILLDHVQGNASVKSTRRGSTLQTQTEHNHDQKKMSLAIPELCWRLVKLLAPLQALLFAIQQEIREDDRRSGGEASIPSMDEFVEFICGSRNVIVESEDWP